MADKEIKHESKEQAEQVDLEVKDEPAGDLKGGKHMAPDRHVAPDAKPNRVSR